MKKKMKYPSMEEIIALNRKLIKGTKISSIKVSGAVIFHKGTEEPTRIFCDKIEYLRQIGKFMGERIFDHHLMFYNKNEWLVLKVYLKNGKGAKEYKDIYKALEAVDIRAIK